MTIGQRAAQAIKNRAKQKGITFVKECDLLGTNRQTAKNWKYGRTNPGSWIIAEMLRQGYDIEYILLGE